MGKLVMLELEWHIEVRRVNGNERKEYLIVSMCPCHDSGSEDVPRKRRTYVAYTIYKGLPEASDIEGVQQDTPRSTSIGEEGVRTT